MAFETRRRGLARREDLREASGDVGRLSRMAPAQRAPMAPGAGRAERLRNIAQKNQLFSLTGAAESRAHGIEMDRARFGESQARADEAQAFRTGQAEESKRRFGISRGDSLARDAENKRRFGISRSDRLDARDDANRRFDLNRRDNLMKTFTPDSVEAELMKTGGMSRGASLRNQVQGRRDRINEAREGRLDRLSRGRTVAPGVTQTEPAVGRADQPAAPVARSFTRPQPVEDTAQAAQRRGTRDELLGREFGDLTSMEGQEVRVGNKNNVPGVYFDNPETGKQQFVGEDELKQYFGDDFQLGAPSASTTDDGTIKFRRSMMTLPTTDKAAEQERFDSYMRIAGGEDPATPEATTATTTAPAPGLQRPTDAAQAPTGLQFRPTTGGRGGRGTTPEPTDFTKTANIAALSTNLEKSANIPAEQMFDASGDPTRQMLSFAGMVNQGVDVQTALQNSGLKTGPQVELEEYQKAKELVQSGEGRGFFKGFFKGDEAFNAAEETVKAYEAKNPQVSAKNAQEAERPAADAQRLQPGDLAGSISVKAGDVNPTTGKKRTFEEVLSEWQSAADNINDALDEGEPEQMAQAYSEVFNSLPKDQQILPLDLYKPSAGDKELGPKRVKGSLATRYLQDVGVKERAGLFTAGTGQRANYRQAYDFWRNSNKKKNNKASELEFQTELMKYLDTSMFRSIRESSLETSMYKALKKQEQNLRDKIDAAK